MATPKNNSVLRAFAILRAFDEHSPEMTANEIAAKTGLNGATTHRFLLTLEDVGAVVRTQQGRFQLGMALADLGGRVSQYKVIADAAADHVKALVQVLRETVHVAVLDGTWVIDVVKAEPARSLRIDAHLGRRLHAYCTAFGKVLLGGLDDDALRAYLDTVPLERKTATTITEASLLRKEIAEVRRTGFAIDDQETEDGLYAISVPIVDPEGTVRAALAVSGPAPRLGHDRAAPTSEILSRAASEIASKLFSADAGLTDSDTAGGQKLQSAI